MQADAMGRRIVDEPPGSAYTFRQKSLCVRFGGRPACHAGIVGRPVIGQSRQ
jgi:hypothetical protein